MLTIRPYSVVRTPDCTLVKVDLRAYTARVIRNYNPEKVVSKDNHLIACNTNFFWKGEPIGLVFDHSLRGEDAIVTLLTVKQVSARPCLVIKLDGTADIISETEALGAFRKGGELECAFQAGPWLYRNGAQVNIAEEMKVENLLSDVNRKCAHTAIGVTKEGKLLLGYFQNASFATIARVMSTNKAVKVMNMDGGHSAWLHFRAPTDDKVNKDFNQGNPGRITIGLELTLK